MTGFYMMASLAFNELTVYPVTKTWSTNKEHMLYDASETKSKLCAGILMF